MGSWVLGVIKQYPCKNGVVGSGCGDFGGHLDGWDYGAVQSIWGSFLR